MSDVNVKGFTKSFPTIVSSIITDCGVSLPFHPANGGKHPDIVRTKGLWDTGATNSVITKEVATKLGLKPVSTVQSHHAGGSSTVNVYLINIYLPNNVALPFVQVSECVETIGRFGLLLGMDIFTKGDFALTNAAGKTTVSFRMPSVQPIHLEKDCLPGIVTATTSTKNGKPVINYNNVSRNVPCPCKSGKKYKNCHGKAA